MYLEVIAVLHYNKHDDVIHAYVSKACFIKVNVFAPSSIYSLLPPRMHPRLPSCICVFHVTAMLKFKCLACGSEDVTQYNTKYWVHLLFLIKTCSYCNKPGDAGKYFLLRHAADMTLSPALLHAPKTVVPKLFMLDPNLSLMNISW